jgi:hypothetical protein
MSKSVDLSLPDRVREVITNAFGHGLDTVGFETPLYSSGRDRGNYKGLCFAALDLIEIVMDLERHFDIEIADDEAHGWELVADVVATVERLVLAKPRPHPKFVSDFPFQFQYDGQHPAEAALDYIASILRGPGLLSARDDARNAVEKYFAWKATQEPT